MARRADRTARAQRKLARIALTAAACGALAVAGTSVWLLGPRSSPLPLPPPPPLAPAARVRFAVKDREVYEASWREMVGRVPDDAEAADMQALEAFILATLGVPDPYAPRR